MQRVRCYWLLNHQMLDVQRSELEKNYGINEFVIPTESVSRLWNSIPPSETIPDSYFDEIVAWFHGISSSDVAVVQGEPTLSFRIVSYLLNKNVSVLAAVTKRVSKEEKIGEKIVKTSVFKHACFRRYMF